MRTEKYSTLHRVVSRMDFEFISIKIKGNENRNLNEKLMHSKRCEGTNTFVRSGYRPTVKIKYRGDYFN